MGGEILEGRHAPVGDPRLLQPFNDMIAAEAPEGGLDNGVQGPAIGHPGRVIGKSRVGGKLGQIEYIRAELRPFPLVLDGEQHFPPVAVGIGAIGRDGRMRETIAGQDLPAVDVLQIGHIHPVGQRMEKRDCNMSPLSGPLPRVKGLQHRLMRCRTRGDVADRDAHAGHALGRPGDRGKPALGLNQQVIGLEVLVRSVLAIAGDRQRNEARMPLTQHVGRKTQPVDGAGREVLDEDVCPRDHPHQDCSCPLLAQVKADGLLAPVQPDEIGAFTVNQPVIVPGEIPFRPLDLDDPRTRLGQSRRNQWRSDGLFDGNHKKAGKVGIRHDWFPFAIRDAQKMHPWICGRIDETSHHIK